MGDRAESAIVTYDFINTFPLCVWVSSWGRDESYPGGFRYKVFSRREPNDQAEMVLVLEERDGLKTEMKRLAGPKDAVLGTARSFVSGLAESYHLEFDEFDLSGVSTLAELESKARTFGWSSPRGEDRLP